MEKTRKVLVIDDIFTPDGYDLEPHLSAEELTKVTKELTNRRIELEYQGDRFTGEIYNKGNITIIYDGDKGLEEIRKGEEYDLYVLDLELRGEKLLEETRALIRSENIEDRVADVEKLNRALEDLGIKIAREYGLNPEEYNEVWIQNVFQCLPRTGKDYHGDIIEWIGPARKIKNGSSENILAQGFGLAYALETQDKKNYVFYTSGVSHHPEWITFGVLTGFIDPKDIVEVYNQMFTLFGMGETPSINVNMKIGKERLELWPGDPANIRCSLLSSGNLYVPRMIHCEDKLKKIKMLYGVIVRAFKSLEEKEQ